MTKFLNRYSLSRLDNTLQRHKSILLLGPRQAGKSTLIRSLLSPQHQFDSILLQNPQVRLTYEQDPARLINEYKLPNTADIIFIDEIQKVPTLFDSIQYLIDEHHKTFILTGSSARKLRRSQPNLLPGRIILHYLDPLLWGELGLTKQGYLPSLHLESLNPNPHYTLEDCLVYGSLPEVTTTPPAEREELLHSYTTIYLEEEIRAEALSRNLGTFSSFLELTAQESGSNPNYAKLATQTGISPITVKEYFCVLEDTLIIHKLPPYIKKTRKRLVKTPKYYYFDIGVRNAILNLPLNPQLINANKGLLFEHFVILEIFRRQHLQKNVQLYYWRTQSGLEVDLVIDTKQDLIPLEIKAGTNIRLADLSGLSAFINQHHLDQGYVISQDSQPYQLNNQITVIPWNYL